MKQFLLKHLPDDNKKRKKIAIIVTITIAGLFTVLGIFGIGTYGMALFIITPLFIGVCPVLLVGIKKELSKKEALNLGFLTLGLFGAFLIVFAIEGLICLVMAAPIALLLTWLGILMAISMLNKQPNGAPLSIIILIVAMPSIAWLEKGGKPAINSVVTSIEIDAPAEIIWKNVVHFPTLKEPEEFLFKTGIAYPIGATIEGQGVGAIRYCNFNTGSFVEPITVWNQPKLLQFNVEEQPAPMKELSFWDINAPHLHDYFVSKRGQFKLISLANGKTRLEGTTWYYHKIAPAFYWKFWSDFIVHAIHWRVLNHIKNISELETRFQ